MTDTIFLPGPNLRVANNDSGMSLLNDITTQDRSLLPQGSRWTDSVENATNEATTSPQAQAAAPACLPSGCQLVKTAGGLVWRAPDGTDYPYQEPEIPLYLPLRSFEPGVTDKVDPLDPSSYTEDVHTNTEGEQVRVQRAKPAPLPENATLQDRLRRYSPTNGYARYTNMAADQIDKLERDNSRLRGILLERNTKVHALTVENELRQRNEDSLSRANRRLHNVTMQYSKELEEAMQRALSAEGQLNSIRRRGYFTNLFHALKGTK